MSTPPIALGARLIKDPRIVTLGFKPNFQDYSPEEQSLILQAQKIYYPTAFYADLFNAMEKQTFPSYHTYKFALNKIRQTAIFKMQGIPHPITRVFYGKKQKATILDHFKFPFIAKKPKGSSKGEGVFLIQTPEDLELYLQNETPAYIQEYLPIDRDMRIIIIGNKIRLAYWRIAPKDNFRTNLSQGGKISFAPLPEEALDLALSTAQKCGLDDIGIDILEYKKTFYVLEANVKYGMEGFSKAGVDYKKLIGDLVIKNEI